MADRPCAILPVAGDCLEGVDVVDGGWVAVDFTRRPRPQVQEQGRRQGFDLCLCYATFPERLALRSCIRVSWRMGPLADGRHSI